MTHPTHNPMNPRHSVYAEGYAIGFYDIMRSVVHFHWYDEQITVPYERIYLEFHAPWGPLARIDEVRAAAVTH